MRPIYLSSYYLIYNVQNSTNIYNLCHKAATTKIV